LRLISADAILRRIAFMNHYFSKEGLEKLKSEYEQRTTKLRGEIATRLKEAKDQGDLKENQEFTDAKEEQALNEGRIEEIRTMLDNAVLFAQQTGTAVALGSTITVKNRNTEHKLTIVGPSEADPASGRISHESPLGAAFLGHGKGDKVSVTTPRGEIEYTIVEIA